MKIGFIGLGIMGKPMVHNILKAGYPEVLVWNRSRGAVDICVSYGATASTPKEIGETCDVVITMLPNSPEVKEVMLGEGGVASWMKPGSVFIDCSSINPVASQEIAAVLAECWTLRYPAESPKPSTEPSALWWAANRRCLKHTSLCC